MNSISDFLRDSFWVSTAAAVAALFVAVQIAALLHKRRKSRAVFAALGDSTRSKAVARRGLGARGFVADLVPAPEPFRRVEVDYRAASPIDAVGLAARLLGRRPLFVLRGELLSAPTAELVWARGKAPARALGRNPGNALWVNHRLDFANTEFATRGLNTSALRRAFSDMQTRFGDLLIRYRIQRGEVAECEIVLNAAGLDAEDVAALITTIRAAGRAALRN